MASSSWIWPWVTGVVQANNSAIDAANRTGKFRRMLRTLFRLFFTGSSRKREAQEMYIALVRQSRNPFLFTECGIPDTLDGRFDSIILHLYLQLKLEHRAQDQVMRRLLIECLFEDMDRSLREMGVGDMGVGKRVKTMSRAAYGRLKAYSEPDETDTSLRDAFIRNVYRGNPPSPEAVDALLRYVRQWNPPELQPQEAA